MITAPGFYPDITPEQYFAEPCPAPAFTNSGAKTLMSKTPADFAEEHPAIGGGIERARASAEMIRGDIVHQLALGKGSGYFVIDAPDFRTKVAQQERDDAIANGLTPVLAHKLAEHQIQADKLQARIGATLNHIGASRGWLMPPGGWPYQTEIVIAWQEDGIWCRGMLDVWCEPLGVILDPKITKCIYDDTVDRQLSSMGWDMQATLYTRGVGKIVPELAGKVVFENILMHPDTHRFRNIRIDEATRYSCETDLVRAMGIFRQCLAADHWPDFGLDASIRSAPPWKMKERMEREMDDNDA